MSPGGQWQDKQYCIYRTVDGALANFWPSNHTINFQGQPEAAAALERALRDRSDPRYQVELSLRDFKRAFAT